MKDHMSRNANPKSYMKPNHKIRIFYHGEECRDKARNVVHEAMESLLNKGQWDEPESQDIVYDIDDISKKRVELFALDIEEPLFWECYVMMQDCSRPADTEWDIGRKSLPPFMSMNLDTIRRTPGEGEPRAVVYQMSKTNPMEPRMLLMAYEENGDVKPVVSDLIASFLDPEEYGTRIPFLRIKLSCCSGVSEILARCWMHVLSHQSMRRKIG
jgi:hypothetical protein